MKKNRAVKESNFALFALQTVMGDGADAFRR